MELQLLLLLPGTQTLCPFRAQYHTQVFDSMCVLNLGGGHPHPMSSVYHCSAPSRWQLLGDELYAVIERTPCSWALSHNFYAVNLVLWSEVILHGFPCQWMEYSISLHMVMLVEPLWSGKARQIHDLNRFLIFWEQKTDFWTFQDGKSPM